MADKMWAGRSSGITNEIADCFNSSISFDCRMYKHDIKGSIAHAMMLGKCGIIPEDDMNKITEGLKGILEDIESGKLEIDMSCEDIHMFVEKVLTERIGDAGKKLHTARSRNDQVTLDLRLYLMDEAEDIISLVKSLIKALNDQAEKCKTFIVPGYTHLQRAQPILFSHQLLAYAMMLLRDVDRIRDAKKRMNVSPIGSCALAGTTYSTDRMYEAELLGFDSVCENSIDGVSDRDYAIELLGALSMLMMHLSRLSEEILLWSSWEFKYITLDDAFTTGSSIMPQKKNSDMAELVRGKTGRVYGDLMALLTAFKGLPLAYNKDMQEDKEAIFDCIDTVKICLEVTAPMIDTMKVHAANMRKAASEGFINATDLADYMTKKGMPFRAAYKISGEIVAEAIEKGLTLETMTLADYKAHSDIFEEDIFDAIDLDNCVARRISYGGTGPDSVAKQIEYVEKMINM